MLVLVNFQMTHPLNFQHDDAPPQLWSHHALSCTQTGLLDCLTSYLGSSLSHEHRFFSPKHAPSFYKVLYFFEDVQELGMNFIKPLFLKFLLRTPASLFHSPYLSTVTARLSSKIIQKILGLM